ncbi:MAG: DUF4912 domain-containing protein [Desulfobacterales bacterium]|nr:DUF4912 domain-containing protein [Desulfobacterales bacterium]
MGGKKIKRRQKKNGEKALLKPTRGAKTIDLHQAKEGEKVEESSLEPQKRAPAPQVASGLASESKNGPLPYGRRFPVRLRRTAGDLQILETGHDLLSEAGDLPHSYDETRVVLLPVEPYLIHAYWEVTFDELEKAKHRLGDGHKRSQSVLRFYDITNIVFDGTNAHSSFDVHIDLQARNWYVRLWSPEKSYFVELGFKAEDGRFFPSARSNIAHTPRVRPAPRVDERYMHVAGDYDLLEIVPMPIGRKPSYDLMPPPTYGSGHGGSVGQSSKEKARPSEVKTAQPIDSARILRRRLAELSRFRMGAKPPFRPEVPSTQDVNVQYRKERDLDLTEMSERRFTLGVSSKQNRSSRHNCERSELVSIQK